jgi:hypothetical protein
MEELEQIVDEMINAGEDDASIQSVIKLYKSKTKDEPSSKVGSKTQNKESSSVKDAKKGDFVSSIPTIRIWIIKEVSYDKNTRNSWKTQTEVI